MSLNDYKTKIVVENRATFDMDELGQKDIRILSREGDKIRVIYQNKSYDALIKEFDYQNKTARLNVNGYAFTVKLQEPLDQLINDLGFLKSARHSVKEIRSPMPGLVVGLFAAAGDQVKEGDKLLSLEAMKMENILKSPGDGTIKSILVTKGQSVDKNQVLIVFE